MVAGHGALSYANKKGLDRSRPSLSAPHPVGRLAFHAVIVAGSILAPDDLAANHRRVDGIAVHPT